MAVLAPLCYFVAHGWTEKTHFFLKARAFVVGSSWKDRLLWLVGEGIFHVVLSLFNLLGIWIGFVFLRHRK